MIAKTCSLDRKRLKLTLNPRDITDKIAGDFGEIRNQGLFLKVIRKIFEI